MMTSTVYDEPYEEDVKTRNVESGYASGASDSDSPPEVHFSKQHLKFLNAQLAKAEPEGT
jgi:phosphoadenosine phosphosulfate reductase